MQYVAIRFSPNSRRTYTYHNEGEPVRPGDTVEIFTPDGVQRAPVVEVTDRKPPFATKPIIRRIPT